jgi:hypothetical protein
MDDLDGLEDTVGKLSLSAKEWRPGQGFASSDPTRQVSVGSGTSGSSGWNAEERTNSQSSWGGELSLRVVL